MKEERRKQNNKIIPFDTGSIDEGNHTQDESSLGDAELDALLRESFMREADEEEKRLNRKPELRGVGASKDLFLSIVEKLKEEGVWEETPDKKNNSGEAEWEKVKRKPEDIRTGQSGGKDEIYAKLSEEDRKALELGRAVQEKRERRRQRRKKMGKVYRFGGVAAAMLVIVFGAGMSSEANRRLVLQVWDTVATKLKLDMPTYYAEKNGGERMISAEEQQAWEQIWEQMDVTAVEFVYLPAQMKYEKYDIIEKNAVSTMFYSNSDAYFNIVILKLNEESSFYYMIDSESVLKETLELNNDITVKIWQTDLEEEEESYLAEIDMPDSQYILKGKIELNEMKKIVENINIL